MAESDILDDLHRIIACNGDTYSSYEVMGLLKRAAAEIEEQRASERSEAMDRNLYDRS